MKIYVFGSTGMLGRYVSTYLGNDHNSIPSKFYEVRRITRNDLDITQVTESILEKFLRPKSDDIVINCAGTVKPRVDELGSMNAILANSLFPHRLSSFCEKFGIKMIHITTDCVFSGGKGNYSENDIPDGSSFYSMTKRCGEIINKKDLSIRTSYIGPCLENKNEELFDWFMYQTGDVDGFEFAIWNGVTTLELAKVIEQVIINNYSGLYHLGSKKKISKLLLLTLIKNQWGKVKTSIKKVKGPEINRSLIDSQKFFTILDYETMFGELYSYMKYREDIYGHYS